MDRLTGGSRNWRRTPAALLSVIVAFLWISIFLAIVAPVKANAAGSATQMNLPAVFLDTQPPNQPRNSHAPTSTVFLPLSLRQENSIVPPAIVNGDFESGGIGWWLGRGAFISPGLTTGVGSGITVTIPISHDGSQRGRLGDPAPQNGSIPVGFGVLWQSFNLNQRYLLLDYRVFSYDIMRNSKGQYYDTFEVAINQSPTETTDLDREQMGCASLEKANPSRASGAITIQQDGLAFCAGYPGDGDDNPSDDVGELHATEWRTALLDLQSYLSRDITLYITIWSREYVTPYIANQAFYNTWAYVDNVRLTNSPYLARPETTFSLLNRQAEHPAALSPSLGSRSTGKIAPPLR